MFEVENSLKILNNVKLKEQYQDIILDNSETHFLNVDNFAFNRDGTKVATKDFRVLVDDLNGSVTREEMLHVISIASLMLSGLIEYPIGSDYIRGILGKYGYTEFTFQENGYLHITINSAEQELDYKVPPNWNKPPKK